MRIVEDNGTSREVRDDQAEQLERAGLVTAGDDGRLHPAPGRSMADIDSNLRTD